MNFDRLLNTRLDQIVPGLFNLLAAPFVFIDALSANIQLELYKIGEATERGAPLTIGMFGPLAKWGFFLALIVSFSLFIVFDSAWHIFFKKLTYKRLSAVIIDLLLLGLVLFLYYIILASVIFFFFSFLLPLHRS